MATAKVSLAGALVVSALAIPVAVHAQPGDEPTRGVLVMSNEVTLTHGRAFPRTWSGRDYVVIVATNESVADGRLAFSDIGRSVLLPETVQGLAFWINTATRHVDDAQFSDEETAYQGGYFPKDIDLNFTAFDDKHVAGRISVPQGTLVDGKPMFFQLEVDLPVTPLGSQPAPTPKPAAKPVPSPRSH